jgi:hypothetical protein
MTSSEEYHNDFPTDPTRKSPKPASIIALGLSGVVIGVGGYLAVMLLSRGFGWWTASNIIFLLVCSSIAITLGVIAIIKCEKLIRLRMLAKIFGIASMVVGGIVMGFVLSLLILMIMLAS